MKRLLSLIFILCLCLSGCGGGETADTPATAKPVEYIDIAEAKPLVEEFITSDTFTALQSEFTRQLDSKAQGPYLDWMIGFAMEDLGGEDVDYIVFHLQCDVADRNAIGEGMHVLYDRDTQTWHDSMTTNFDEWYTTFTGDVKNREDSRNAMLSITPGAEGSVIYHWQARERWLSKADVAAINSELGLTKPQPRTEQGFMVTELNTAAEERLSAVSAAAETFFASEHWRIIAEDPLAQGLEHAMEYKNDDFRQGRAVHVLLMRAAGVDTELHDPHLLVDMSDGRIYTTEDLDMNDGENDFVACLASYTSFLEGRNEDIWGQGEARAELSAQELATINAALAAAAEARREQHLEAMEQAAADLSQGIQTELYQLTRLFQDTGTYRKVSVNPGVIRLTAAAEYQMEDLEGYNVHALLLAVDGVDTDTHGFFPSILLLDRLTNTLYTFEDLDLNYFGDFSCPEHALAAVMSGYETVLYWETEFIWSEMETLTPISEADIAAVNAALDP